MNKILEFFANFIDGLSMSENYVLNIVVIALFMKLILLVPSNRYFKSIKIGEHIQPMIDKIREKHKKRPEKANEEISTLLMQSGFSLVGGFSLFIIYAVIGVIISFVFANPYVYLHNASESALTFMGINVSKSAYQLFLYSENLDMYALMSLVLVVIAIGLQYLVDTLMGKKMIVDQSLFRKISLFLIIVGSILLSESFVVYWIVIKLMDLMHYFYTVKFVKVSEAQVNSTIESNKRRMKK